MTTSTPQDATPTPAPTRACRLAAEFVINSQAASGHAHLAPAFRRTPSFRRYFRATWPGGETAILMDAPPDKEDVRPFVQIAESDGRCRADCAAKILAADVDNGYLLLNDLGHHRLSENPCTPQRPRKPIPSCEVPVKALVAMAEAFTARDTAGLRRSPVTP